MPAAGKLRLDKGDVDVTALYSARVRERRTLSWTTGSTFLMSFVALALAGCGSGSNILGGAGSSGPQATLTQSQTQPAAVKTAKIQIAPVIGSPDNVARDLQTQLASAISNRRMTVATGTHASRGSRQSRHDRRDSSERVERIRRTRLHRRGAREDQGKNLLHLGRHGSVG